MAGNEFAARRARPEWRSTALATSEMNGCIGLSQVPTKSAALLCFCGRCFNCIQGEKGPLRGGHRKNGAVCCHAYSMKDSCGHREVVPRDDPAPEQVKACGRFCSLTPRMRLEAQGKQRWQFPARRRSLKAVAGFGAFEGRSERKCQVHPRGDAPFLLGSGRESWQ